MSRASGVNPNNGVQNGAAGDGEDEEGCPVSKILDKQVVNGQVQYFVQWDVGHGVVAEGWEFRHHLIDFLDDPECNRMIQAFEEELAAEEKRKRQAAIAATRELFSLFEGLQLSDEEESESEPEQAPEPEPSSSYPPVTRDDLRDREVAHWLVGLVPVAIRGATACSGELLFLMEWEGTDQQDLFPARKANIKWPQLVIEFYESKIQFNDT